MNASRSKSRFVTIPRWIARIWSLLLFGLAVLEGFLPETEMEWPVLLADWLLLGFYGAAILGLLLAWRWQALGGLLALAALAGRFVFWRLARGEWAIQPFGLSLFSLPALLYLLSWAASLRSPQQAGPAAVSP